MMIDHKLLLNILFVFLFYSSSSWSVAGEHDVNSERHRRYSLIHWEENEGQKISTPFNVENVIEKAKSESSPYLTYVKSDLGKRVIKKALENLNKNRVPNPDVGEIGARYNRNKLEALYNLSSILYFVVQSRKREESWVKECHILINPETHYKN